MQDRPQDPTIEERLRTRSPDGRQAIGAEHVSRQPYRPWSHLTRAAAAAPLRKLVLGGLLLFAAAFAVKIGLHWVFHGRFQVETDDAYVEADTTIVAPEATGTVAEVAVAENAQVQAGDVLVRLADADAKARLAQADSALATFKAALANTEARLKWQDAVIKGTAATVASAHSDVTRTAADHERYQRLHADRYTSSQRYEQARNEAEKARAALSRADAGLDAEHQQLAVLVTQRDQARAQIQQAEAQLELARIELTRTVIRAPVPGVIGNRGVQVGQYVRPGTQLLAIVPIPLVRVVANFKETQIAGLKKGQPVEIRADAWPDVHIRGRVESLAPSSGSRFSILPPENATGNFTKIVQRVPVRIAIDPSNALSGHLRPGLSVIVTIDRRGKEENEPGLLRTPSATPVPIVAPAPADRAAVRP